MKKDKIFILVLGVILANLVFQFAGYLAAIFERPMSVELWSLLIANGVGICGILWLFRVYKKGRKVEKEREQELANKNINRNL